MSRRLALLLTLAASSTGCINTFDASLYQRDAGGSDAGAVRFDLADDCTGEVPEVTLPEGVSEYAVAIDTTGFANDSSATSGCLDTDAEGLEGFFRVAMQAGERWHFHFRHTGDIDPALYLLSTCDVRSCQPSQAIDNCGSGADEHLSVEPTTSGDYFVVLDAVGNTSLAGTLQVIHPTCGNGRAEHSETCDDGNTADGDDCDSQCRQELHSGANELEVNDDAFGANHLLFDDGSTMAITGRIASVCESDWFAIDVAAGQSLRAELLQASLLACDTTRPANIELSLVMANGQTVRGVGSERSGCASIDPDVDAFATSLPAGRYYLRVYARNDEIERPFDYGLRVTLE